MKKPTRQPTKPTRKATPRHVKLAKALSSVVYAIDGYTSAMLERIDEILRRAR